MLDLFIASVYKTPSPCIEFVNKLISLLAKNKIVKLIDSKREEKENSRKMTETFDNFYKDLKATEKADSVLTPTQQIDRLLRPGSTYRNLNPYEVKSV